MDKGQCFINQTNKIKYICKRGRRFSIGEGHVVIAPERNEFEGARDE